MPTDRDEGRVRRPYIVLNVLGVNAETKVAELSVGQLVELLSQLFVQLPEVAGPTRDPDKVVEQIRQIFDAGERITGGGIDDMVRASQRAILERISATIRVEGDQSEKKSARKTKST